MQKKIFIYFLILCQNLYFSQSIKGFHIPDSLRNKNIKQVENSFKKTLYTDKTKAEVYANTALVEGKKNRNNEKIAEGYQMLYQLNNDKSALLYLDSMITVSKKIQDSEYLSKAYRNKGVYYYYTAEYSKSLDNYLIAKNYAKKGSEIFYNINSCIGLLKLELEDYREALNLLLGYKQYLEKNKLTNDINYEKCLYNLAYAYHVSNKLDSSNYYVKRGFEQNLKSKDKDLYASLSLVLGINTFKQANYNLALPILNEASQLFKENPNNVQNIALVEYYIGKILYHANNEKFLDRFEKVDSIITKTKNVSYELRNTYPILIEYYKKTGNKEKQLFYIEHLLSVDSILSKNNKLLTTEINNKYDTPLLLKEKEILISDLNSKNYTLFWILGIVGGIMIYLVYLYKENRKKLKNYQNKADLLTEYPVSPPPPTNSIETVDFQKEKPKATLSNDKLEQLSRQLNEFEIEKRFLDKKINLDLLSKEFNTNRAYLSRSVNELKGQNFSQYLNALRIQYIVSELKTNKNLQKLTIAAIADEAGYNNVESFTNAFKKITDTLPSYFMKALQENNK
ncbi:AraC family transcriptional regulator [Chryseobacterium sp. BIGb0232]|uniref:helix-turn-helix domain-containing protein n=1 Tax=Chryseobacterium sp. BIGb0232 TaxID=2940598 RepID=UPI000F998B5F|nr:AraC family transcriptional regulator [Chryseobacterium sp. BIGb0232]MCS4305368.1 AraC-like DNA-binding protein [Chryseobacterium sp. BIGb0232]ROS07579.1 AraC-like DNA-binding protein [Chryseobacterium nakagawai]